MKQRWTARLGVSPNSPAHFVFVIAVFAIAGTLQTGCKTGRVATGPTSTPRPAETLRQAGTLPSASSGPRLVCPDLSSSGVAPTLQAESVHRVTLSWKASAPASSKHAGSVGYCVYRGLKHKDSSPELLNSVPFPGPSCAVDLVGNGKTYYYVVRAISATGVTSIVSNEVAVTIPTGKQAHPSVSGTTAPLCREPASLK